jgi:hypothetical protein
MSWHREDVIMVLVTMPSERWEVEFLGKGSIEVERFLSDGEISGEEPLRERLTRYAAPEHRGPQRPARHRILHLTCKEFVGCRAATRILG